jgi:hypothetical protein
LPILLARHEPILRIEWRVLVGISVKVAVHKLGDVSDPSEGWELVARTGNFRLGVKSGHGAIVL